MIIQLQIAFGVVYIGSWQDSSASPSVAIIRTLAILYGCLAIFLSSMIAIPLTSLNVSAMELSECLRSVGKLAVSVCNDKTHGVMLLPYDHRAKAQATAPTSDEHTKFMDAIDGKLNRG